MKKIILSTLLILAASTSYALGETKIASCQLVNEDKKIIGSMDIFSSDNGDEELLRFTYMLAENADSKIEFTDNVQDDGTVFLISGKSALYVSLYGTKVIGNNVGNINVASVYLENQRGVIRGKLKADFQKADLVCQKSKN